MAEELKPEGTGISQEELDELDALLASPPGKPSFSTDPNTKGAKPAKQKKSGGGVLVVVLSLLIILIVGAAIVYFVVL